MKDYGRIITKIGSTPWLATPESLNMILTIIDRHMKGHEISAEELEEIRLAGENRGGRGGKTSKSGNIGVIPIHGPIFGKANMMTDMSGATSLETFANDFNTMMDSADIGSILLDIDSGGGTSDLVSETGAILREARDVKPLYAIANTSAGSAAYWLGAQADKFYITPSGMVGSIGAFTVHQDQSGADKQDGLKYTFTSAGRYKTEGNPHEALSLEAQQYRQEVIDELYTEFVDAVAAGRKTSTEDVRINFGGGRMVTPQNALKSGMVDGITTFDELVSDMQVQPQHVSVAVGDGAFASALFDPRTGVVQLESKEWEHSEPGSGSPPTPRRDEDGSDDKAIKNGWRRNIPAEDDHSIPTSPGPPNSNIRDIEGGEMADTLVTQLATLLGVPEDGLFEHIKALHETNTSLTQAVHESSEMARLAKEYPSFYSQHLEGLARERARDAKEFVSDIAQFTKAESDGSFKSTGFGLSALAKTTIEESHLKFAQGEGSLADFEEAVKAITQGGVVNFTEIGSSRPKEVGAPLDTTTPVGIQTARNIFGSLVAEIMVEMKADASNSNLNHTQLLGKATAEAARRDPELAAAYRTNVAVK